MKKLILGIAVVVAGMQLSALAEGEILYWQINNLQADAAGYSYAQLYYSVDGGETGTSLDAAGWTYVKSVNAGSEIGAALASGMTGDTVSFFVEYFNDANDKIGFSDATAWSALAEYVSSVQSNPPTPQAGAWVPNFTAVPEPTSGLLMLLGLAGLALRRKRA